jgi:exosome complex component RRP40
VHPTTGKAEGLGPLKGGMVFDVSGGFARRLMLPVKRGGCGLLEGMAGRGVGFEVAVGRNGRVWVGGEDGRVVVAVGRALCEVDERGVGGDGAAVKEVVGRVVKELGL